MKVTKREAGERSFPLLEDAGGQHSQCQKGSRGCTELTTLSRKLGGGRGGAGLAEHAVRGGALGAGAEGLAACW